MDVPSRQATYHPSVSDWDVFGVFNHLPKNIEGHICPKGFLSLCHETDTSIFHASSPATSEEVGELLSLLSNDKSGKGLSVPPPPPLLFSSLLFYAVYLPSSLTDTNCEKSYPLIR